MKAELGVRLTHEYVENMQFVPSKLGVRLIHECVKKKNNNKTTKHETVRYCFDLVEKFPPSIGRLGLTPWSKGDEKKGEQNHPYETPYNQIYSKF